MSESNICVLANRYKTIFYDAVLTRAGHSPSRTFWIVNGRRWRQYLLESGYPKQNILYYDVAHVDSQPDQSILREIEFGSDLTLRQIVLSDRRLADRTSDCDGSLSHFARTARTFLRDNDISLCFGECTWSVELVTAALCRSLGIPYVSPHTIRIPSERFAFFTDPLQRSFLTIESADYDDPSEWQRIQTMISTKEIPRPNYWYINNQAPKVKAGYGRKLIEHAVSEWFKDGRSEYMDQTLRERITHRARMIRNARAIRRLPFVSDITNLKDNYRLVLMTLHKQPEASIDVMGGAFTDQAAIIEQLSRLLPCDVKLLVKEHSNALGDRGRAFYDRLLRLGNVVLIDPWADSRAILTQCEAAVTVSGTITMEASILGTRAICLCNAFFTSMPNVYHITDLTAVPDIINRPLTPSAAALDDFFSTMLRYSHHGLIGDPYCVPGSMDDHNLDLVASAFRKLIDAVQTSSVKNHG